jgi:hypothetical protein
MKKIINFFKQLIPFHFFWRKKMFESTLDKLELGETELDYIPKSDMGSIGTKPKTQKDYVREHTANLSKKRKTNKPKLHKPVN